MTALKIWLMKLPKLRSALMSSATFYWPVCLFYLPSKLTCSVSCSFIP